MISRGRTRWARASALAAVAHIAACGDDGNAARQETLPTEPGVFGGASRDAGTILPSSFADGGALSVQLGASKTRICTGECTTLSAAVAGGNAPYALSWSDGLADKSTLEVCPSATHEYQLLAHDSGGARSELDQALQGSARITIQVDDCATNNPGSAGSTLCRVQLPLRAASAGQRAQLSAPSTHALAVDGQGNSYLALDFAGSIDVGANKLSSDTKSTSVSPREVLLAKIDAQCRPVWSHKIGGAEGTLNTAAVAVDGAGNVLMVGGGSGQLDFGGGMRAVAGTFVAKWSESGAFSWLRSYGLGSARSVASNEDGDVLFTAEGPTVLDFGGGPVLKDTAAIGFAAVKLDAQGQHVFTYALPLGVASAWINSYGDLSYVAGIYVLGANDRRQYVHKLEPDGSPYRQQQVAPVQALPATLTDERAVCDGSGNVVLSHRMSDSAGKSTLSYRVFDWVLDEQTRGRSNAGDARAAWPHAAAAHGDHFAFAASYHGSANNSANDAAGDLLLELRDTTGDVHWTKRIGDARNEWPLGLAMTDHELIVLSAAGRSDEPEALILTRLSAD